jgi:hypothetical protein
MIHIVFMSRTSPSAAASASSRRRSSRNACCEGARNAKWSKRPRQNSFRARAAGPAPRGAGTDAGPSSDRLQGRRVGRPLRSCRASCWRRRHARERRETVDVLRRNVTWWTPSTSPMDDSSTRSAESRRETADEKSISDALKATLMRRWLEQPAEALAPCDGLAQPKGFTASRRSGEHRFARTVVGRPVLDDTSALGRGALWGAV